MKLSLIIMSFSCFFNHNFPSEDIMEVTKLVHAFSKNSDERNIDKMDNILHQNYRTIVNQAFGSDEIQLMNKTNYLDLLKRKVIGGDKRSVIILSIDMEENNAVVKAKFTGKKLIFTTFIQLVKDSAGKWKIISDLPIIQKAK